MIIEKTLTSLLSRSSVFDAMLDKNMLESQVGEVDILDVEPEFLKQMLEFIYTGQVLGIFLHKWILKRSISQVQDGKYTEELLYAADKYGLIELVIIILCYENNLPPISSLQIQLCARQFRSEVNPKLQTFNCFHFQYFMFLSFLVHICNI